MSAGNGAGISDKITISLMSDRQIIERLKNSDRSALREVFDAYHRRLYNFLLYRSGSPEEAEDLLQDLYIRLWQYREQISDRNFVGYLFTMARNLSLNRIREQTTELNYVRMAESQDAAVTGAADSPVERDDRIFDFLESCINLLPEKQRTTLLLNRSDGLTYREIASYLELSVKAIEKRMQKAYDLLRECMKDMLK